MKKDVSNKKKENTWVVDEDGSVKSEAIEGEVLDTQVEAEKEVVSYEELLPQKIGETLPVPITKDPLSLYIQEISRYKLLSIEQERILTKQLVETGDIEIAKSLVQANLRLVVKIAMEYRYAYNNILDLIQEGNIGLMKAVSKYDPTKGAKLSYYSSWWIRSFILKFILDNFSLVKIGTTAEQKKLFYNLNREKNRLLGMGIEPNVKLISENLGVSEKSVNIMEKRLSSSAGDVSIDKPIHNDGGTSRLSDVLPAEGEEIDDALGNAQNLNILKGNLGNFLNELKERDREIFQKRLLSEVPASLQSIANDYGVTRERIRQIEVRLLNRLREYMSDFLN